MVSAIERSILPRDLAGTVAHAGIDPTLESRALQDALRRAIATRRGSWLRAHRRGPPGFDSACPVSGVRCPVLTGQMGPHRAQK